MNHIQAIEVLSLVLGIIATIGGGIAWYRGSIKKGFASEQQFNKLQDSLNTLSSSLATLRDLKHFQRSLDQHSANIAALADELKDLNHAAIEQATTIKAIWHRVEAISARIDSSTSGWGRRSDG